MILETTPYSTVIKTMYAEREKVRYFFNREIKRQKVSLPKYGGCYIIYTHPESKNRYMYWAGRISAHGHYLNTSNMNYISGICLLVNTSSGELMVYQLAHMYDEGRKLDSLIVYSSHFLKRYRERCGYPDNMSSLELVCDFMHVNFEMRSLDYNKVVRNQRPNGSAFQCADGIILGTTEKITENDMTFFVAKHGTFISEKEFKVDQSEEWMTEEDYRNEFIQFTKDYLANDPYWSQFAEKK